MMRCPYISVSIACTDYLVSGPDGRGTEGIANDQISASSFLHIGLEPWKSRLNATVESNARYYGGWMPTSTDNSPYIQAEFGDVCEIREVATLGRYDVENWVEAYTVSYSINGSSWVTVSNSSGPLIFPANTNSSEVVVLNSLSPPFSAKYVRLYPKQWTNGLALRFDLVGCCNSTGIPNSAPTDCSSALATKSYGVRNSQITASSFYESPAIDEGYEPWAGRLEANTERCNSYWAVSNTTDAYVQVDFRRITNIYCIVTMGHLVWYVESYNVLYSMDGSTWYTVLDVFGNVKLFAGNDGPGDSMTTRCLPEPLVARYVRIKILSFNNALLLKFDFIGCNATNDVLDTADDHYEGQYCLNYLSSGNNPVWDESFTASSFFTIFNTEPWMARLTSKFGWAPVSLGFGEYIQVMFTFYME
ncbi:lactadherin-like [Pecten maximus]|uniref:lactadherin-like n=1 Tax=Pecten maximus TaxID=6579 RepID=UPI001458996D|nr:lactadherin-like [Pecten maximus]